MPKHSFLTAALSPAQTLTGDALVPWTDAAGTAERRPENVLERLRCGVRAHFDRGRLRRHHRRLADARPLALGHLPRPLAPAAVAGLLAPLRDAPAGAIRLTVASPADFRALTRPADLRLLSEIDQHHALEIDLLLTSRDLADLHTPGWRFLRSLTDHGLATRAGLRFVRGLSDREFHLHRLFQATLEGGVYDLFPVLDPADSRAALRVWTATWERLRLNYDCPRLRPGRG